MQTSIVESFLGRFLSPPQTVVRAPGRINLLGDAGQRGFVLAATIDRAAWVAATSIPERQAVVRSLDFMRDAAFPLDTAAAFEGGWTDYPRGVAWALQKDGLQLPGMNCVLVSNVPVGIGLASSAAVELAFAYTWKLLGDLPVDLQGLAHACHRAESEYIGGAGSLDELLCSALGRAEHALLIDAYTQRFNYVPFPAGVALVVIDSGVHQQLGWAGANLRRAECEEALALLSGYMPGIRALRDVGPADLQRLQDKLPDPIGRRARHIVMENVRVIQAAAALSAGHIQQVGELLNLSHASLRDDFEASCPELDLLVGAAWEVEGCYGARMVGAGLGGCVLALVADSAVEQLTQHATEIYREATGYTTPVYVCHPADGVGAVPG